MAAALASTTAHAQDDPAGPDTDETAAPTQEVGVGTIIVTAQRREQDLQETPIAITALGGDDLNTRSVEVLTGIDAFVPNARIINGAGRSSSPSAASFFIRGIGQTDFIFSTDPGVGLYVDGVYLARSPGSVLDLGDVDRLEVLRGPQGTLFGKNTIGGAINVVTRQPSFTPEGDFEFSYGSFDTYRASGYVSGPLSDQVAAKLSATYTNSDGYGDIFNVATGEQVGEAGARDDIVVRGALLFEVSDTFSIDVGGDYSRLRDTPTPVGSQFNPNAPLLQLYNAFVAGPTGFPLDATFPQAERFDSFATNGTNEANIDSFGVRATITVELGAVELKSITAYRELDSFIFSDADGTPSSFFSTNVSTEQEQFSQEITFSGEAFDDRLTWLVGAYYLNETAFEANVGAALDGLYQAFEALPGPIIPLGPVMCPPAPPPAPQPPLFPCAGGAGNPLNLAFDNSTTNVTTYNTDSYALFAHTTFALTDALSVTAGVRQTWEEKGGVVNSLSFPASGRDILPPNTPFGDTFSSFSPTIALDYQFNDNVLGYVSASRGFKSGGFNARARSAASFNSFGPENVWTYEAGLKLDLADNRLRVNSAVFYNDYTDLQLTREIPGSIDVQVVNAGEVSIKGFEVEIFAQPTPRFSLNAAVGYLDAQYERLDPGVPIALDASLPAISDWTVSAGAQHVTPIGADWELLVRGDVAYRSDYFNDIGNSPNIDQDGYALVSARIMLSQADSGLSFSVYGTNLTDETVLVGGLDALDALGVAVTQLGQRPREIGVSFGYSF
ncbi:TonB-dependent receptor [Aurantiacibacter sediminis]|uniref:TonB-dependent receptor n=1 Tax=Aurantiacibacter sediminis TaxID=2793064 RepID=A0ABS0N6S4_9SPHN|nr:TonB-dependent receptor [Aurantiacibacter sediminis]MBH5323457.1 TonB-dependent receptor [Aurantiacibacter sediminis]